MNDIKKELDDFTNNLVDAGVLPKLTGDEQLKIYKDKLEYYAKELERYKNNPFNRDEVMSYHVGDSDYSKKRIQPWDIWEEYDLNPWDADIVKRVLRNKESQSRKIDYEKIKHICDKRISQINKEEDQIAEMKMRNHLIAEQPLLNEVQPGPPPMGASILIKQRYPNGEITFNDSTQRYTVWDETYSDVVCETPYLSIGENALEQYGKSLEGPADEKT